MQNRIAVLSFRFLARLFYGGALLSALSLPGCSRQGQSPSGPARNDAPALARVEMREIRRHVRATGSIQPVEAVNVSAPEAGDLVLTRIARSGTLVNQGDIVAEFDRTRVLERARDAQAKYDDLLHQIEQRLAEQRSNREKRASDLQQAEADLAKARIELRKGPLLSEIDRLKNESKLEIAAAHVESLKKSGHAHDVAEAADLRTLELRRDRQQEAFERARADAERLQIRSPLRGMVVQDILWRQSAGQPGHPQEGDQLWPGQALLKVFASAEMEMRASVAEPDGAMLVPGIEAEVRLDAYPDLAFPAHLEISSPVASGGDTSVRTFDARFRLDSDDRRLLPDLSAAVDVELKTAGPVLAVPRTAVRYRQGSPYVTVAGHERAIELGRAFDDQFLEVASGLAAGDEVSR